MDLGANHQHVMFAVEAACYRKNGLFLLVDCAHQDTLHANSVAFMPAIELCV